MGPPEGRGRQRNLETGEIAHNYEIDFIVGTRRNVISNEHMRRRIITAIVVLVLCAMCFPIVYTMVRYRMTNPGLAVVSMGLDKTSWATGFSESLFRSIEIDSTPEQVQAILGPALYTNVYDGGMTAWHYTVGPNGYPMSRSAGSKHVRGIAFSQDMRVTGKSHYFYVD